MLQVNISLMMACLVYFLLLRNLTFFKMNRYYLIAAIVLSATVPFIMQRIAIAADSIPAAINDYTIDWQQMQQNIGSTTASPLYTWKDVLLVGYFIGVISMGIIFIVQIWSLFKIHQSAKNNESHPDIFISEAAIQPFSFLKNVYINPNRHSNEDMHTIIHHERIHTDGWHSLDLILAEINKIFFWFNPGAWLMKLAITENLEFIADQLILRKGNDKKQYQYQLLKALVNKNVLNNSIANQFSFIQLKNRIKMMNKKNSSAYNRWRYALTIPMLVIVSLLFANKSNEVKALNSAFDFLITQDTIMKSAKNYTHIKIIKNNQIHVAMVYDEKGKEIEKINFKTAKSTEILAWNHKYGSINPPQPPAPPSPPQSVCAPAAPIAPEAPAMPHVGMEIDGDSELDVTIDEDNYSYHYDAESKNNLEAEIEEHTQQEAMRDKIELFHEKQALMQEKMKTISEKLAIQMKENNQVMNEKMIALQLKQIKMQQTILANQQVELLEQRKELLKEAQIRAFKKSNTKQQQPKQQSKSGSPNIEIIENDDEGNEK